MTRLTAALALSLLLSIVLEGLIFFVCAKRDRKDFLLLVLVNILTNPPVVLSYWLVVLYTSWNRTMVVLLLEAAAVLVEAHYYKKYGRTYSHPLGFSLLANGFSYFVGLMGQFFVRFFT